MDNEDTPADDAVFVRTDNGVAEIKTKEVKIVELNSSEIDSELLSLNDEITNFERIMENRLSYIKERKEYLSKAKEILNGEAR